MGKKIVMPPKDEELFGFTEIYLEGEMIAESNPLGLSLSNPVEENEPTITNDTYSFESVIGLSGDLKELLRPRQSYDMVCTEINGLKYTFTDGNDKIVMEYKYLTDEIRKIQVGVAYRIIPKF